jgi:hypothetical protein
MTIISLIDAAKYFNSLPGQTKAFDYLTSLLTSQELNQFAILYRDNPVAKREITLLSQRDYKGDLDHDGKNDAFQTCNIHSVAMALDYYDKKVSPKQIDEYIKSEQGSRYSHASLAKALNNFGVKSFFSTATTTLKIIQHLEAGEVVIWSNKLTQGGHIVLLSGYDKNNKAFNVYDPYGQPSRVGSRWLYQDIRKVYQLSLASFNLVSMNGATSSGHWSHLLSKI